LDPERLKKIKKVAEKVQEEAVTWRDLRILWHSVAPWICSGYGKVTKYFTLGLANRGFPLFISSYFGLHPGGTIRYRGLYVLPIVSKETDKLGFETVAEHYKRFQCDLAVFTADFWVSYRFAKLMKYSLCYSPIDHVPESYPEKWLSVLRAYNWVAVPAKFAVEGLKKVGIEAHFLPHGVDTSIFKPLNKEACRKAFTLEKDKFVIGIVGANNDDETRKSWGENFRAYKIFLDNNPDAKKDTILFVHSNPENPRGRNLIELSRQIGIEKYIIWNDSYMANVIGLPEIAMAKLYNCFDVFLLLSRREGFCLPALEAQACGVPCILNDFSALSERNRDGKKQVGWLVKPAALVYSPLNAINSIADPYKAADALEEAYNKESTRKMYAKRSLAYARKQTWDVAIDKYFLPLLKEIGETIPRTSSRKKLKKVASG